MPPALENVEQAHRFFSADCFNRTWSLIDKAERTAEDNRQMLLLALASLWHWTQRSDGNDQNLSIGYWQVSRVYALLGQAASAQEYAEECLRYSQKLSPFLLAYAHEAAARAALVGNDQQCLSRHTAAARELLAKIEDAEERRAVENDLLTLG